MHVAMQTLVLVGTLLVTAGCGEGRPRVRLGCLPYPHTWTFFEVADPASLGVHQYDESPFLARSTEIERGIVYTCDAGFLDIAHMRITIDWVRYMAAHVEEALAAGEPGFKVYGRELTWYDVRFDYPADWEAMDAGERDELITELAIRIGSELAYDVVTWHEIITWFGYKRWVVIPEDPSAFTYEDVMSHVIGLRVADRALRDGERTFDEAVTAALSDELQALGALTPEGTLQAIDLVEGRWWIGDESLVRHLDIGLGDGIVEPMLVPGIDARADGGSMTFALPSLADVCGRDLRGFYEVRIETGIREGDKLRELLPAQPERFDPRTHFGAMMEQIEREVRTQTPRIVRCGGA